MNGNGKIARLPREIREELNRRLDENEPGGRLLSWLNRLPAVRVSLREYFGGVPISKQNLSEWRNGGFKRWQAQRELLSQAREMASDADELAEATDGRLTDHLATVLGARYAAVLSGWDGEASDALTKQLRVLKGLCRDVVELRRSDQREARLKLAEEKQGWEREKTEEEVVEWFEKWLQNAEVRKVADEMEGPQGDGQLETKASEFVPHEPDNGGTNTSPRPSPHRLRRLRRRGEGETLPASRHEPAVDASESNQVKPSHTKKAAIKECDGRLRQLFGLQSAVGQSEPPEQTKSDQNEPNETEESGG